MSKEKVCDKQFAMHFIESRKASKLTIELASGKLGISRQTLIDYEKGRIYPTVLTLYKMCKLYNVSPNYMITGENENFKLINDPIKRKASILLSFIIDGDIKYDGRLQKFEIINQSLKSIFSYCYAVLRNKNNLTTIELIEEIIEIMQNALTII